MARGKAMEGARQRKHGKSPASPGVVRLGSGASQKKSSGSWFKTILVGIFAVLGGGLLVLFLIPSPVKPVDLEPLPEPPAAEGPLAPNDFLTYAEKLYLNQVPGPESFAVDGDTVYTGCSDGWVKALRDGKVRNIVQFGKGPCGGPQNENTCGRPLGMRLTKDGSLFVLDAYHGLFKVNLKTGEYTTLYASTTPVNGKTPKLLNDLDIGPDGKIYFTDSSTTWHRNQFLYIILEGRADGRLLQYEPSTKKVTQLMDGLVFANGVQLTKDKTALLVTETVTAKIHRYDLKTKKAIVWSDSLPGFPDNIRYSSTSGNYWVGIAIPRRKDVFSPLEFLLSKTWLRGILAKVLSMDLYQKLVARMNSPALAVELDEQGQVVGSLQAPDGRHIQAVSEVEEVDGQLYLGSFHAPFVGWLERRKVPGLGKK